MHHLHSFLRVHGVTCAPNTTRAAHMTSSHGSQGVRSNQLASNPTECDLRREVKRAGRRGNPPRSPQTQPARGGPATV